MSATTYETIEVTPLTAQIGAVIDGVDLRKELDELQRAELRRALLDHLVIFLHDQDLSDDEHIAAARNFGEPNVYTVTRARGLDQPLEWIEDSETNPPKTDLWHTDVAFLPQPPEMAMINMKIVPSTGGDTMWCSLYAAHDSLSPAMQVLIAGLEQDLHPGDYMRQTVEREYGADVMARVEADFAGSRHPLVRVHPETGRRALFMCGKFVKGITGMNADESTLLYEFLRSKLDNPNGQVRWKWQPNDVAIWDERCTNHRGLSDHFPAHRLLRRCTIGASQPVGVRGLLR
jgi:taurine dioxygenase